MFRSFLTITFRILWRNKVTSFVNIFSLSVGITAFVFIMLYVLHETSYDKFNNNYDRIYRLEADEFGKLPPAIGMHLKANLPEVENVALLTYGNKGFLDYIPDGNPENLKQIEGNFFWADSTTFDVFTFPFIQGDHRSALQLPMSAVLAESTAKKLFGDVDPMGKAVELNHHQYMITGIMRDIKMSHIEIDFLLSLASMPTAFPDKDPNYNATYFYLWNATYLLMPDKVNKIFMEEKINKALSEINDGINLTNVKFDRFHLRPLSDLYFDGEVQKLSYGLHGNMRTVLVLLAIGIFMLVLAVINYVNLTTARSTTRAKEIGVKRITGSTTNLLRIQLIGESIIISFVSLTVALTFVQLFLPIFNQLTTVNIRLFDMNGPLFWAAMLGGGVLIGILAGIYPAFYLTAIQPVRLVKGGVVKGSEGSFFRSGLMTFQFALSIIMMVGILVNLQQLHYLRTADLGFNKEQIITLNTPADIPNQYALRETFYSRLLQHAVIKNATFSFGNLDSRILDSPTLEINGTESSVKAILTDPEYLDVMEIELNGGRNFITGNIGDLRRPGDPAGVRGVLINETLAREFGIDEPLGKLIYAGKEKQMQFEIIGIVKDFHFRSFHDKIEPLIFLYAWGFGPIASIKVASSDIPATLKTIQAEWKNVWGNVPFNYQFLDEAFNRQYQRDEQLAKVIGYFTILAMIIACLGLFALSSFMVTRRVKEIGVRKTMGASVGTIYSMLSWDFLKWILVAIVIACPAAWYLMKMWLDTFAYHITLGADVFVLAALLAITIALLTVTGQSLKVARANPIDSLRYE